jgi:3-dehydroquinate synthase
MKIIQTPTTHIEIGSLVDSSFETMLTTRYAKAKKIIIVDENTHDFCLEYLLTSFEFLREAEVMLLPVGEENKVLEVCFQVWEALTDYTIGRNDVILNLGGGVVTDMGGFIASIYKRGIDFIHIPTTLLGMVDASIGGKNGVDLGPNKNQLGVFSSPTAIFVDSSFLGTLPSSEWLNGYAEIIKHALISSRDKFLQLAAISLGDIAAINRVIEESIGVKVDIVSEDPLDTGRRKTLNFGHTVGHALEGYFLDKSIIAHGHAVAIGMLVESFISMRQGRLNSIDYTEIERFILSRYPVITIDEDSIPAIVQIMKQDKKNQQQVIYGALLSEIGTCDIDCAMDIPEIEDALHYLIGLSKH